MQNEIKLTRCYVKKQAFVYKEKQFAMFVYEN